MENKKITNLEIKSIDELNFTVEALVTNDKLDGDNEIIINKAWKTFDRYKKNPVLMSSHDIWSLNSVIGKCQEIKKSKEGVTCKFEYFVGEGNAEADWAFVLAKKGIAAFSVGFIAHGYEWDEDKIKDILKEEGIKVGKGRRVRGVITEAELYEVSQVNVPCNADALMKSKSLSSIGHEQKSEIIDSFEEIEKEIKSIYDKIEIKRVVPFKSYPVVDTATWDADSEIKKIRSWAGFDSEGKGGDWSKYSKAFTFVVDEKDETFGAYKFPHHSVEDGEIKTNRKGVFAAMQRLSAGDLTDEERRKVYNHLAKHYTEDLNEEPPEFKNLTETSNKNNEEGEEKVMLNVDLKELVALTVEKTVKEISKELIKNLPDHEKTIKSLEEKISNLSEENKELKTLIVDFEKKFVTIKEEEDEKEKQKTIEEENKKKKDDENDLYSKLLTTIDNFDFNKKEEKKDEKED